MNILIAPDSFKECLTAREVAAAIARGWRSVAPEDEIVEVPLADGGEGTTEALVAAKGGRLMTVEVTGPLGHPVQAAYGLLDDGDTAVVEVAEASGLHRVPAEARDAMAATSFGTGELMLAALSHRPRTLVMGLGGSATTDGGAGILQALGAHLLDSSGKPVARGGGGLADLASVDLAPAVSRLAGVDLVIACDVTNPLLGPEGAAAVFGPQKGASPEQVAVLNANLERLAKAVARQGYDMARFPGSGAAGGIGGTLAGLLGGQLRRGIELVMETLALEAHVRWADLVITAEGAIDSQSAAGKTPAGVAALAKRHGVPVIGLAGRVGTPLDNLHDIGLTAAFSITPAPMTLVEAYADAPTNLARVAEQLARLAHNLRKN